MGILTNFMAGAARPVLQYMSRQRLPQTNGRLRLSALQNSVTIRRDQWGIPHIKAQNRHDMYMAQGVVHAQDRLWQLEINRRVATGRMAAVVGPEALDLDRLTRTLGFARLAPNTWEKMSSQMRADVEAYTQGINAYLNNQPAAPVEFRLLGIEPAEWRVLDTLAIGRMQAWAMARGWSHEIINAQLIDRLGPELAAELNPAYPNHHPSTLPTGIEYNTLKVDQMLTAGAAALLGKGGADGGGLGSNAWVLAPKRTTTGRPLLCNDVHLPVTTPGLWYHLSQQYTGGQHVSGVSLPGTPHVVVGHNAHIAWGITLAYTDCEDLFVEKINPHNHTQYEVNGRWEQATVVEERIAVKGTAEHIEQVVLTRHGPLIHAVLDTSSDQALALQATSLQDNRSFTGLLMLNDVHNWEAFTAAMEAIDSPSLNILYADTHGNIGYYVTGLIPIRAQGEGSLPAPGWTNTHGWQGFVPFQEKPHLLNPAQGYILSCNNRLLQPKGRAGEKQHFLGATWMNGFRAQRLQARITGQTKVSPTECQAWQLDYYSVAGVRLVEHLATLHTTDAAAHASLQLLQKWHGRLEPDSAAAAVYQVLLRHLSEIILKPMLDDALLTRLMGKGPHPLLYPVTEFYGYWPVILLRMLENPHSHWLPAGVGREAVFIRALRETTHTLRQLIGKDITQWQWGRLHQVSFPHALGVQPVLDRIFSQGPYPIGGDTDTVSQTATLPATNTGSHANNAFAVSYRQVIDVGAWEDSYAMHTPGQSGHLASPHYGDLIEPWLNGQYYPMLWGSAAIDQATRTALTLVPPAGA